jgi:hypothetical protein
MLFPSEMTPELVDLLDRKIISYYELPGIALLLGQWRAFAAVPSLVRKVR